MIAAFAAIVALTCVPTATDGDTVRCGPERIRLLGIDAPEMPGHCRQGRVCVSGDPFVSRDNLAKLLAQGPYTIERVGTDRYGRTLAVLAAHDGNVSCAQLTAGVAEYVGKWDNGGRIAAACPAVAR